jgi:hypothetical protein
MAELPPLNDALRAQFAAAREAERTADLTEPRAREAYYDPATGRLVVELKLGGSFAFPPAMYPQLEGRSAAQLGQVQPSLSGDALEWDDLDVHIAVAGILVRMLGPAMLRAFGQRGGSSTSERKAAAARANGARGGRPRKQPLPPGQYQMPPAGYGVLQARERPVDERTPLLPEYAADPSEEPVEETAPEPPPARRGRKRKAE